MITSDPRLFYACRMRDGTWQVCAAIGSVVVSICSTEAEAQCVVMDLQLAAAGRGGCCESGAEGLRAAMEQTS